MERDLKRDRKFISKDEHDKARRKTAGKIYRKHKRVSA